MGVFVHYSGTTPEGLTFQGCYAKLASFVADTASLDHIVLVGCFAIFLSRDARVSGKRRLESTTIPANVHVTTSADELQQYSFGIVEFLYERYMLQLLKEGFVIDQVLEDNQTAPPVPIHTQDNVSNENEQVNGSESLEDTNAVASEP